MTKMTPTDEQQQVLDLFGKGDSLVIEAGAGAAKTTTLRMCAEADMFRRGQYTAFSKALVEDAKGSFPSERVRCNTVHSLAFGPVGKRYAARLRGGRMRSSEVARRLRINQALWLDLGDGARKGLQPAKLASLAMRTVSRFCQTADEAPGPQHLPYIKGIDLDHGFANQRIVGDFLRPAIARAWDDIRNPDGELRFEHAHYLKLWERESPYISADYLLVDEAQDISGVMLSIIEQQKHAQVVWVGDSAQAIFGWLGLVDALKLAETDSRVTLSRSFRFGPEIAAAANAILERLESDMRLIGAAPRPGHVGDITGSADAVLTRTNAEAVRTVIGLVASQRPAHLVGGADEVLSFARAAEDLQRRGWTTHAELACFESWAEVKSYVAEDPSGDELKLLVELVDGFGVEAIERALTATVKPEDGVTTVSTIHKSKGREWDRVRIASDFEVDANRGDMADDLRLAYVAITRARRELDPGPLASLLIPIAAEPAVLNMEATS